RNQPASLIPEGYEGGRIRRISPLDPIVVEMWAGGGAGHLHKSPLIDVIGIQVQRCGLGCKLINVKMDVLTAVVVHGSVLSRTGADIRRNLGYKRGPANGFCEWTDRAADLE